MNLNAINNYNPVFRMNENNAGQAQGAAPQGIQQAQVSQEVPVQAPIAPPIQSQLQAPSSAPSQEGQPAMQPQLNQDMFSNQLQMPNFKKMKTSQQIMGGSLLGVAALGILSACSSKTWVRMLFTVPVAGVMGLFGYNMLQNAKAVDKIAALYNNPQGQ